MCDVSELLRLMPAGSRRVRAEDAQSKISQLISQLDFFSAVTPDALLSVAKELECVELHEGVIFFQGQPPDCVYVVLSGSVELYHESDVFVERHILKQISSMDPRVASAVDKGVLGEPIACIESGHTFGELSVLAKYKQGNVLPLQSSDHMSTSHVSPASPKSGKQKHSIAPSWTQKIPVGRPYSAVVGANGAVLMVISEKSYTSHVIKHRLAQIDVVHNALLLWSLPILQHASFANTLATSLVAQHEQFPHRTELAAYKSPIEAVLVVIKGDVGVRGGVGDLNSPGKNKQIYFEDNSVSIDCGSVDCSLAQQSSTSTTSSIPKPAIAILRPGNIVGEVEIQKGISEFKFTYEVQSLYAELLRLPVEMYAELVKDFAFNIPNATNRTVFPNEERLDRLRGRTNRIDEVTNVLYELQKRNDGIADVERKSIGSFSASPRSSLDTESVFRSPRSYLNVFRSGAQASYFPGASAPTSPAPSKGKLSPRTVFRGADNLSSFARSVPTSPSIRKPEMVTHIVKEVVKERVVETVPKLNVFSVGLGMHTNKIPSPRSKVHKTTVSSKMPIEPISSHSDIDKLKIVTSSGPNACKEYAATPAEAAQQVQGELVAIRARILAKKQIS